MNWLNKLERKFGRIGVPNLMLYIVIGNLIVFLFDILLFAKGGVTFSSYLSLNPDAVMHGQVWRLITFVFIPPETSPIWLAFVLYFYYFVGSSLESAWGSFRFTLYYLIGMIGTIIAGLFTGAGTAVFLNLSLFFAFATLFPDHQVLLFFFIPIKVKWLGLLDAVLFLITIVISPLPAKIAALVAIANYFLFFGPTFINKIKYYFQYRKTRNNFRQKMKNSPWNNR